MSGDIDVPAMARKVLALYDRFVGAIAEDDTEIVACAAIGMLMASVMRASPNPVYPEQVFLNAIAKGEHQAQDRVDAVRGRQP